MKKHVVEPKVYAVVLAHGDKLLNETIHVCLGYSLENVVNLTRNLIRRDYGGDPLYPIAGQPKMYLVYPCKDFVKVIEHFKADTGNAEVITETRFPLEPLKDTDTEQNKLMKRILKAKSLPLLRRNKKKLTTEQFKFLTDELKK